MIFVHSANSNGLSSDPAGYDNSVNDDNKSIRSDNSFHTANGFQSVNGNSANFNLDSKSRKSSMDEFLSIPGSEVGGVKDSVSKNQVVQNKIYVLEDDTNDIRLLQDQSVQPDLKCLMIDDKDCLKIRWNMNEFFGILEIIKSIVNGANVVRSIEITSIKTQSVINESKIMEFAVKLAGLLTDKNATKVAIGIKITFKIRCEYDEGFVAIGYTDTINALKNQANYFVNSVKNMGKSFGLSGSNNDKNLYIEFNEKGLQVVNLRDTKSVLGGIYGSHEYNISLAGSNEVDKCNIEYSSDGILSIIRQSYSKDIIDLIKNINNSDKKFNKIKFEFNEIVSKDAVLELLKLITVDIFIFDVMLKKTKIMSYVNNQLLLRLVEKYSQDIIDVIANDQRFKDIKLHFDQDITINEYKELLNDKIIKDNRKLFVKIKDKDVILFENEKLTINGISYSKDVISAIAGNNVLKCIELSFNKNIEVNEYGELLELIKNGRKLCVNVVGNSGGLFSGAISTDVIKFDHASELIVSCQKYSKDIVDAVMSKSVENVKLKFIEDVDADIYLELLKKFVNNKKKLSFTAGEQEIVLNNNKLKLKFHEYSSAIVDAIINCGIKVVEFNLSSEINDVICKQLIDKMIGDNKSLSVKVNVGDKSVFEFKDGTLYVDLLLDNKIRYLIFNNNSFNDIQLKSNLTGDNLLKMACDLVSEYSSKSWKLSDYCSFNEGKLCVQSENCAKALELIANHSCWQYLKSIVIYNGTNKKFNMEFDNGCMEIEYSRSIVANKLVSMKLIANVAIKSGLVADDDELFKGICVILNKKLTDMQNIENVKFVINTDLKDSELDLIIGFGKKFEIKCKGADHDVLYKCIAHGVNFKINGEDFGFEMTNDIISVKSSNIVDVLKHMAKDIDGKNTKFIDKINGKILKLYISDKISVNELIRLAIALCSSSNQLFSSIEIDDTEFYSNNGFNIELDKNINPENLFYSIVNDVLSLEKNYYFNVKYSEDLYAKYSESEFHAKFDCAQIKNIEKLLRYNKSNLSQIRNQSKINELNISKIVNHDLNVSNISPVGNKSNVSKINSSGNNVNGLDICIENTGNSTDIGQLLELLYKNKQSNYKYINKRIAICVNNSVGNVDDFDTIIEIVDSYIDVIKFDGDVFELANNMSDYVFRISNDKSADIHDSDWIYSCDKNKYISKSMNGILKLFNDFIVIVNGEVTIKSSNDSILDLCKLKSLIKGIESIEQVEDFKKTLSDLYKKKLNILLEMLDVDSCNIEANDIISQGAIEEVMGDLGINNDINVFSNILGDSSDVGDPDSDGENSEKYPSNPDIVNDSISQSPANNDLDGNHNYWLVGIIVVFCVIFFVYSQGKVDDNVTTTGHLRVINEMPIENFNMKLQDSYTELTPKDLFTEEIDKGPEDLSSQEVNKGFDDLSSQEVNKGPEDLSSQEIDKGPEDLLSQETDELLTKKTIDLSDN